MKIGILTREFTTLTNTKVTSVVNTYLKVIKRSAYPIIIDSNLPLNNYKEELLKQIKDINGFILPGGDSISEVDLFIIDYCYKNDLPLLGICLGMQEIAYYFDNNTLFPIGDLSHFDMRSPYLHSVTLTKNSYLSSLLNKDTLQVNSRHKYQIKENENYEIEARADNVIEAIKVKNKTYILGVQFHIEIMDEYDDNAKLVFADFFSKCS